MAVELSCDTASRLVGSWRAGTLTTGGSGASTTFSGGISGSGSGGVAKEGSGTMVASGVWSFTGGLTVNLGTLALQNTSWLRVAGYARTGREAITFATGPADGAHLVGSP